MLKMVLTLISTLFVIGVFGQNNLNNATSSCIIHKQKKTNIEEINSIDKFLRSQLTLFIDEELVKDSVFKTRGYVNVFFTLKPLNNDTTTVFIMKQFSNFDDIDNDKNFPSFYMWLNNKMILFYVRQLDNIVCKKLSLRSKKKFVRKIEPFLAKQKRVGRFKNFRPDEVFQLHGGKTIYLINDEHLMRH